MFDENVVHVQSQSMEIVAKKLLHDEAKRTIVDTFRRLVDRIDQEFTGTTGKDAESHNIDLFTVDVSLMVHKWDIVVVMKATKAERDA